VLAGVASLDLCGLVVQASGSGVSGCLGRVHLCHLGVLILFRVALRSPLVIECPCLTLLCPPLALKSVRAYLPVVHGPIIAWRIDEAVTPMGTAANGSVSLLDVEPHFGRFLPADGFDEAARELLVPVRTVPRGPHDVRALLEHAGAFGAVVLEGILFQRFQVADQVALLLLGPGDVVSLTSASDSTLLADSELRAAVPSKLGVLASEVMVAARRWPQLAAGLYVRASEQLDRMAAQLVICQIPRVGERLLALMWLLAESWGHVTTSGTRLPISLTHDALGEMVGARRPTVTLALGELIEQGAILRQDRGWLLVAPPPQPAADIPPIEEPRLLDDSSSDWADTSDRYELDIADRGELLDTVARLHEQHVRNARAMQDRLAELARVRERCAQSRKLVMERTKLRRAPST
jgi:CRP-like cAMP-binding protein